MGPWRVKVCTDEQWAAVQAERRAFREQGLDHCAAMARLMQERGEVYFHWYADRREFMWQCPGCGRVYGGTTGEHAVSGWNEPRWVNSGTLDAPTLHPSLGCQEWRAGKCFGHFWLENGSLRTA